MEYSQSEARRRVFMKRKLRLLGLAVNNEAPTACLILLYNKYVVEAK